MTTATQRPPEIWMEVIDPKKILKLAVIQGASKRAIARAAGYESHTYVLRMLNGDPKAKTLNVEPAVRIAHFFGVGTDDLFVARTSSEARQVANLERKVRKVAA